MTQKPNPDQFAKSAGATIQHVSDTAIWVATFRAQETQRPDALFKDPLASRLVGARGPVIADSVSGSRYVRWSVIIRTCIIDDLIQKVIKEGVDTVINLGCGLDTRPYRLSLPYNLRWIEVDFPQIIDHKSRLLLDQKPNCRLERVTLDFLQKDRAEEFFKKTSQNSKKVLILTEGVIPYFDLEQAGILADLLRAQSNFSYWIVDYNSPTVMKHMNSSKRKKEMKNAPFKFFPPDWFGYFKSHGWVNQEIRYMGEESIKLGREIPVPWWAAILRKIFGLGNKKEFTRFSGFALLKPYL